MEAETLVCYERWNIEKLEHIKTLNLPKEIARMLRDIKLEEGCDLFRVRYTKRGDPEGRFYARIVYRGNCFHKKRKLENPLDYSREEESCFRNDVSLQGMVGWVRRLVASDYYRDFDIVNCAPTLMAQLLQKYKLCPPTLTSYTNDREKMFEKYKTIASPERVKKVFLEVMHMGQTCDKMRETILLKQQLKQSLTQLYQQSESYGTLFSECLKQVREGKDKECASAIKRGEEAIRTKALGKFSARVWQREEHCVLMCIRNYFIQLGCEPTRMVLCFDGLMVEKEQLVDRAALNLDALSEYILLHTEYRVAIKEKSLMPTAADLEVYEGKKSPQGHE